MLIVLKKKERKVKMIKLIVVSLVSSAIVVPFAIFGFIPLWVIMANMGILIGATVLITSRRIRETIK